MHSTQHLRCLLISGCAADCRETQIKLFHQCMKTERRGVDSVFDVLPSNCAGQNLKKEAATDIRMHTVVLIPTLTHTGVASKSNQGRRERAKID